MKVIREFGKNVNFMANWLKSGNTLADVLSIKNRLALNQTVDTPPVDLSNQISPTSNTYNKNDLEEQQLLLCLISSKPLKDEKIQFKKIKS